MKEIKLFGLSMPGAMPGCRKAPALQTPDEAVQAVSASLATATTGQAAAPNLPAIR